MGEAKKFDARLLTCAGEQMMTGAPRRALTGPGGIPGEHMRICTLLFGETGGLTGFMRTLTAQAVINDEGVQARFGPGRTQRQQQGC